MDIPFFIGPIETTPTNSQNASVGQVVRPEGTSCQSCRAGFYFKEAGADGDWWLGLAKVGPAAVEDVQ